MSRKPSKAPVIGVAILLLLGLAAGGAGFFFNTAPETTGASEFQVSPGDSLYRVADNLENENLIRSADFFRLWGRLRNLQTSLKVGRYQIPEGASASRIMDILVSGIQIEVSVTIPEGYSLKQIAGLLEDRGITTADDFLAAAQTPQNLGAWAAVTDTAQGLLFPETYQFPKHYPAAKVVRTMISGLEEFLKAEAPDLYGRGVGPLYEKIILASVVEKEYRAAEEAGLIAGVFANRLEIDMPLQSCATVVFVKTEILDQPHPDVVYYRDLEIDSPYNTYIYPGLPPGPISSPGAVALKAALTPRESDYLFFLLKDAEAGRHIFTKTYSDHQKAGRTYLPKRG